MPARVTKLRTSPVKGLPQREVDQMTLTPDGAVGDRRFVIADDADRVLYSAYLDELADVSASYDAAAGTLTLRCPDGETATAQVVLGDEHLLTTLSGRPLPGHAVGGPFAGLLSVRAGRRLRLFQVGVGKASPQPLTVLGDGSVRRLANQLGVAELDARRFKMSIELAPLAPHAEDDWDETLVRVGDVVLRVCGQVPRCVLVTRDPDTRERDHDTLRAILAYRTAMTTGEAPFGMYATVVEPGVIRVGDEVSTSSVSR